MPDISEEANQPRWPGYVMLAISLLIALLVPMNAWWGKLIFWAAVLWLCITAMYLWNLRKARRNNFKEQHEFNNQQVRILIGNLDNNITAFLSTCIRDAIKDKYDLELKSTAHVDELLELAKGKSFDLSILVLNNIIFPSDNLPVEKRIERSLEVIAHLKTTYRKPIIAITGWPDDPSFDERAKHAGASFFFKLPFNPEDFQEAVSQLLAKRYQDFDQHRRKYQHRSIGPDQQKQDKFKELEKMFLGEKEYANNAKATWLVSRGNNYGEKGMPDEALKDFEEALQLQSDHLPAHFSRALVYAKRGENDKAQKLLEEMPDEMKISGNVVGRKKDMLNSMK